MICLVAAFPSEARPLIEAYELKLSASDPFPIYQNGTVFLAVSGMGKLKAACATTYLNKFFMDENPIWLNIGIAGHEKHNIGTPFLAHKVIDKSSDKSWFPSIVFQAPCGTEAVLTVDKCETNYEEKCLYDMEASGFYEAAIHFSTTELIHSFKVVSDNGSHSVKKVTPDFAEKLIRQNLKMIQGIIKNLTKIQKEIPKFEVPYFQTLIKRVHFTVTEQHKLKKLLVRLRTLGIKDASLDKDLANMTSSKEVFAALERKIEALPVEI